MNESSRSKPSDELASLRTDIVRIRLIGTVIVGTTLLIVVFVIMFFGEIQTRASYVIIGAIGIVGLITAVLSLIYTEKKQEHLRKLLSDVFDEKLARFSKDELISRLESHVDLRDNIKSLIEAKKFAQAEKVAQEQLKAEPGNAQAIEAYISTLLAFNSREKCEEAWRSLLQQNKDVSHLPLYARVAFLFWGFGDIEQAIVAAKRGLIVAQDSNDNEYMNRFMNSLAYYYADSGKADYENLARSYIEQIYTATSNKPKWLDTAGYVKIVYGKNQKEILEGLELCLRAYRADREHLKIAYEKHAKKAVERLATL